MSPKPQVRGLGRFREKFRGLEDKYVVIGGTASLLALEEAGLQFRATKDIDIVLCFEALDREFFARFWEFVREGGYERREEGQGRRYYRFSKPTDESYPAMIELFSRAPDGIEVPDGVAITPVPATEDVSSLSAILLSEELYRWVVEGRKQVQGITAVGAEHLIPLKASAFLDLKERRDNGETLDSRNIAKHIRDVVRLAQLLQPTPLQDVPDGIREVMHRFTDGFKLTEADQRSLEMSGVIGLDAVEVQEILWVAYGLDG